MFTAALFTVAESGNKHKLQLADDWINEMGSLQARAYYPLVKGKDSDTCYSRDEPEGTVLSEISGHKRTKVV